MTTSQTIDIHSPLEGEVEIPGDRSMTRGATMLSSLTKGKSIIEQPLLGEDCLPTIEIFKLLGVETEVEEHRLIVNSPEYQHFNISHQTLYTGNSGTTTRSLAGLLSGLGIGYVLSEGTSTGERPVDHILRPLKLMNADINGIENSYTPLVIKPSATNGTNYQMEVASTRVKSATLFTSLFSKEASQITELDVGKNHTETMFKHYQTPIQVSQKVITTSPYVINNIQPRNFVVPEGISSAAFFIVAALISPGGDITTHNIDTNPARSGIINTVKQMSGNIKLFNVTESSEPTASIRIQCTNNLELITIEGGLIPKAIDELPIIVLLYTQVSDTSMIKDAGELKVKETNRIDTTTNMLNLLDFKLQAIEGGLIIHPSRLTKDAIIDSLTDHKVGMMLVVASVLNDSSLTIRQFDAVNASSPGFLPKLKLLGNEG